MGKMSLEMPPVCFEYYEAFTKKKKSLLNLKQFNA